MGSFLACGHLLTLPMNTIQKNSNGRKNSDANQRGALAAAVIGGKIYVVGGANRKIFNLVNTPALEMYDPIKDAWKKLAPLPTPRDHLTASSFDEKLYAIGGRIDVNFHNNLDTNEVYDPKTNLWTRLSPLPTKRSGITSQVLNKRILVFGGESGKGTFTENETRPEHRHLENPFTHAKWQTWPWLWISQKYDSLVWWWAKPWWKR